VAPGTIAASLTRTAEERPGAPALITPGGGLTYRELDDLSSRCAAALLSNGLRPGDRVALMVRPGIAMVVLAFGLVKSGAIPVLIDPGIGWQHLGRCLKEASPSGFVGVAAADWARLVLGWARRSLRWRVVVGRPGVPGSLPYRTLLRRRTTGSQFPVPALSEPAAIVFTSGSTGPPKGVVYTHRMFHAQATLLREAFGIEPGEVDLATFPLFALYDPAWGATTVFPKMDFTRPGRVDPQSILSPIQQYAVTHMFGSPALLDRVGTYAASRGIRLPTLRRVLSAGAPVGDKVLRRFSTLLPPGAFLHTPYGATEALPVTSIDHKERVELGGPAEGRGTCIGRALPGIRIELMPIDDGPRPEWSPALALPTGVVGELVVWGDNVSTEYWARPEADRLAKVRDRDGRIGHRMGDLAYRDGEGRFWFCGRKSHRVETNGGTLFTDCCEGIFNAHPQVFRTALVGVGTRPHQQPVLCVELFSWVEDRSRVRRELLAMGARHPETAGISTVLFHPGFPVDIRHNAKIFREKLAAWAAARLA
jgi:acyl-CoA synthetase (AMP-forming)/AMP-acid ligase II